jgi:hypothetical protein
MSRGDGRDRVEALEDQYMCDECGARVTFHEYLYYRAQGKNPLCKFCEEKKGETA